MTWEWYTICGQKTLRLYHSSLEVVLRNFKFMGLTEENVTLLSSVSLKLI